GEIFVTGRVKDIIIKGGRNLYPHEVEELAGRADGIRRGCVVAFGLKDEGSGTEKLVVVAESREDDAARRSAIAAAITHAVASGPRFPPHPDQPPHARPHPKTPRRKAAPQKTPPALYRGNAHLEKAAGLAANCPSRNRRHPQDRLAGHLSRRAP